MNKNDLKKEYVNVVLNDENGVFRYPHQPRHSDLSWAQKLDVAGESSVHMKMK